MRKLLHLKQTQTYPYLSNDVQFEVVQLAKFNYSQVTNNWSS